MIKGKRVLVTGGAGSIGSELVRQLAKKNKVFILDTNETGTFDLHEELTQDGHWVAYRVGDVRNKETVQDVFSDFKPQYVFHAAAYKHVTPMEVYPEEAVSTNILGTLNVLKSARNLECVEKFVYISTDKVIHSNSVMGATKRVGEIMVKNAGFIAVRFGNVLGSRGSVIPLWQNQIDRGKPITVTDKRMKRYFMTIPQACELVIKASEEGKGGQTFILDMGEQVNIYELAKQIIGDKGIPIKIIGMRPGETLDEELMTREEKERATKRGNFYII
jgi:FlaA1/EpsC-like NDP-sugar epimerase